MSLRLSKKHGVNPSVELCYFCGEAKGVVLFGAAYKNKHGEHAEAPREVLLSHEPCDKCREYMKHGVIFIGVANGDDPDKRTGQFWVLVDEAVKRMLPEGELLTSILTKRVCFIPEEAYTQLGFPVTEQENEALGLRKTEEGTFKLPGG